MKKTTVFTALLSLVLAAVIGVGFFFAMRTDFDFTIGHFDSSVMFYVFSCGIGASALFSAVLAFLNRKKKPVDGTAETRTPLFHLGYTVVWLSAVMFFIGFLTEQSAGLVYSTLTVAARLMLLFVVVSALLQLFSKKHESSLLAVFSVLAALAVNLTVFACYFDFSIPVNSPVRHVSTVAQCGALLFFISEAALALGVKSDRISSAYYSFVNAFSSSATLGITAGALAYTLCENPTSNPNLPVFLLTMYLGVGIAAFDRLLNTSVRFAVPEKADSTDGKEIKQ